MNSDWLAFLTQSGAIHDDDRGLHFGDPERELRLASQADILCDLSHRGLISAQGSDALAFLQGQFTNDARQVTLQQSQLSGYCNPKGRLLACFRLFQRDTGYYLEMPREILDQIHKRLSMYVLRAKVTLANASDELLTIGLAGPSAENLLQETVAAPPAQIDQAVQTQAITVIRLPGTAQFRFEIHGEFSAIRDLWIKLSDHATPVCSEAWRLYDILAGIPIIYKGTSEAFLPQMVNLQLINGLNFRKGCYTGQEIIARTQYLGKLKRQMYLAHVESPTLPRPGDELFAPQANTTESVGKIVDACHSPGGGFDLLAVVTVESAESGAVALGNPNGTLLQFRPLPYAPDSIGR